MEYYFDYHTINYTKNTKAVFLKPLSNKAFKYFNFAVLFGVLCLKATSQITFQLPHIDSCISSIDRFYINLSSAQIEENKQFSKLRWLNYIPSPGYSPFAGRFTLQMNLNAVTSEFRANHIQKQRSLSIIRINELTASQLKNEVFADYKAIEIAVHEYHLRDSLDYLKITAFNLFKSQYDRNELTPSEFLAKQQEFESYKTGRLIEANNIFRSIISLIHKSKMAVADYNDHLKNSK